MLIYIAPSSNHLIGSKTYSKSWYFEERKNRLASPSIPLDNSDCQSSEFPEREALQASKNLKFPVKVDWFVSFRDSSKHKKSKHPFVISNAEFLEVLSIYVWNFVIKEVRFFLKVHLMTLLQLT